ncbi:Endoglucanase H [Thermoflexales bacterium]|nr:Endoglucanase H [Thermoflexales bacterium]
MRLRRALLWLLAAQLLLAGCDAFRRKAIYWGAWVSGVAYGLEDAPWEAQAIDLFESHAGKKLSILHWGQPWWTCNPRCRYQTFQDQVAQYEAVRQRGLIPLVDWASWDFKAEPHHAQPAFTLRKIIRGDHDEHIRQWAMEARNWGHPFFLRFNWEMNGDWFPWSEGRNGNHAGEFVQAWRHVHDIFTEVGASNVTWVWCPNVEHAEAIPLEGLYPGDAYVDWIGMDGYNWGSEQGQPIGWQSFQEVFGATYARLIELSPNKPLMIAEISSTETGGSKAEWITDALVEQLPKNFPQVKAVVWFNWNTDEMDWVIESSPAAQAAFAKGIASPYYAHSEFANLNTSPIPPLY